MAARALVKLYLREMFLNPLLKSRAGIISTVFIALIVVGAAAAFMSSPPTGARPGFSAVLHVFGINSLNAPYILGALLAVFTVYAPLYTRQRGLVTETDYELVLSQPVPVAAFVLVKLSTQNLQGLLASLILLVDIPFFFPGSKLPLTVVSVIVYMAYLQVVNALAILTHAYVGRTPSLEKTLKAAVTLYLAAGILHSVATLSVSPLLAAPLLLPSLALVYSIARTASPLDTMYPLAATIFSLAILYAVVYVLGTRVSPEDLKPPLRHMPCRRSMNIPRGARKAVRHVVLERGLRGRKQFAEAAALVVAVVIGVVLRARLRGFIPDIGFITDALVPLLVAEAAMVVTMTALAEDLLALWAYRVYLVDTTSLAEYLLAKYSFYLYEAAAPAVLFLSAYTWSVDPLKTLLAAAPASLLVSWAALRLAVWLMPRRKVVKTTPQGLHVVESIVSMPVYFLSYVVFIVAFADPLPPGYTALVSIPAAAITFLLASTSLASSLYNCELSI